MRANHKHSNISNIQQQDTVSMGKDKQMIDRFDLFNWSAITQFTGMTQYCMVQRYYDAARVFQIRENYIIMALE